MPTPEGKVKAQVKKRLKKPHVYYHMVVQNGMGAPSLDFVGCVKKTVTPDMVGQEIGVFFAIETKAGNKQPTERQWRTIAEMTLAHGRVFIINEETGCDELDNWLGVE